MSGSMTVGAVGQFGGGAKYGCYRCGQEIDGPEAQLAHNHSAHMQPQGGGTQYNSAAKTKK